MNQHELRGRLKAHFWLKGIGSPLAIGSFFVGYFLVLQHPVFPVRMLPVLQVDKWVPIVPWSVWVYFSLWIYICLPQSLMRGLPAMRHHLIGAATLAGIGLLIFTVWPTAVPTWDVDWSNYSTMAFLKEADASGNACPSLHVAFSVFSALWLRELLKRLEAHSGWHWGNVIWCGAIILSTMTTKQHVFWDVVSGLFLGGLIFTGNLWWLIRSKVVI